MTEQNQKFIDELCDLVYRYLEKGLPVGFIIGSFEGLKFRLLRDAEGVEG